MSHLNLVRNQKSSDAFFGRVCFNGEFVCYSMERAAVAIPVGTYEAVIDFSPHLKYKCPHIRVPARDSAAGGDAGIRIHVANWPSQLDGCVAVGEAIDGDALDSSRIAFAKLMNVLPDEFTVTVEEHYS